MLIVVKKAQDQGSRRSRGQRSVFSLLSFSLEEEMDLAVLRFYENSGGVLWGAVKR